MSAISLSKPAGSAFLRAPAEIRIEIYRYLLSSKYIKREITYESSKFETTYYAYPFQTQILCANRQIYEEAAHVLYKENSLISFRTNHPMVRHILWESLGALSIRLGDYPSSYRRMAMDIDHYCPVSVRTDHHSQCDCTKVDSDSCLLISDQLPNLLRTLRAASQQGNRELAESSFTNVMLGTLDDLSVIETQPTSFIPISTRNLLEPFKLLYGLESLHILGIVNDEYKQSVISSATQPEPTVAEIIEAVSAIQVKGDEAFQKQHFDHSLSLYQSALREFQINRHQAEYTGDLTTSKYARLDTPHAVRSFQLDIHRNLTRAFFKTGEYVRAIEHAFTAIKHGIEYEVPEAEQGLPLTGDGVAIPFFWGGLAFEELGDFNRALYGVGEAMFHHHGNKVYADEYQRLEAEMEKQGVEVATHQYGKGTNWWTG